MKQLGDAVAIASVSGIKENRDQVVEMVKKVGEVSNL